MKTINIKTIRIDGGTQSRVEINNEIVTEYAQAIQSGAEFPAVVVFNDGVDNWLADGFHRFHAHNQAGKASIAADVRMGSLRDAKLFSFGANGKHGQRPNQADRRKAIDSMLSDAEWVLWSNNAIAKTCEVSPHTVAARRESLCNLHSEKPTERTYTTKHGTTATMQTASIGKASPAVTLEPAPEVINEDKEAIAILSEENDRLNDRLAVAAMDATEEERAAAAETLEELRKENKMLRAMNKQLTISRDTFQNQVAEMQKQINRQRREIDKALGTKTA